MFVSLEWDKRQQTKEGTQQKLRPLSNIKILSQSL